MFEAKTGTAFSHCLAPKKGAAYKRKKPISGMVSGSRIITQHGFCQVENVAVGDGVLTVDAGLQVVCSINSFEIGAGLSRGLVRIPAGTLGNREALFLLENQRIVLDAEIAQKLLGDVVAEVSASVLVGNAGIERVSPPQGLKIISIEFSEDQAVYTNTGAVFLCHRGHEAQNNEVARSSSSIPEIDTFGHAIGSKSTSGVFA